MAAKNPIRGFERAREAPCSLMARASFAASGPWRMSAPGAVTERMAWEVPSVSIRDSDAEMDHSGVGQPDGSPPAAVNAIGL